MKYLQQWGLALLLLVFITTPCFSDVEEQWVKYYKQGLYPQAITELNKNFEKEKDKEEKAKILNNLSAIYRQTGDYEKATQGLKQAIKIYESFPSYKEGAKKYGVLRMKFVLVKHK